MKKRLVRGTAMAVFCVAFVMVLSGCGGTGSPANGPGFDERLFGTWENETIMWGQVAITEMKLRNDWTYVIVMIYAENHEQIGGDSGTFTANADIFIRHSGEGARIYARFSLPDANTLVITNLRVVSYDADGNPTVQDFPNATESTFTMNRVTP